MLKSTTNLPRKSNYLYDFAQHPEPRDVVCALLNGVDILLIDPQLYPVIVEPLNLYKGRYMDSKDDKVVEKIEWMLDYMKKWPERQMMAQKFAPLTRAPRPKPKPYTSQQAEDEVQYIMEGNPFKTYNPDQYQQLIEVLRKKRNYYTDMQEFETADRYSDKLKQLIGLSEASATLEMSQERAEELKGKITEAEESFEDMKRRWNKVLNNFYAAKEENLSNLRREQEEEYNKAAEKLNGNRPRTIPKVSPAMLELKRREESLVAAKKYLEASEVRSEINKFELTEGNVYQQQWDASTRNALKNLEKKQDQIYNIRKANLKRDEQDLIRNMNNELLAAEHKLETLKKLYEKTEMILAPMQQAAANANAELNAPLTARSALPPIKIPAKTDNGPASFRQRALLNMKIYTRKPTKSARTMKY